MTRSLRRLLLPLLLVAAPRLATAQERGAITLGESVAGLDVTARVLVIGAHPDDEDTQLITWLARGRQVETGYLSLTRGDGGQNLIGNELGNMLGMIRTEELLAARRLDGGRQFFTRAYDFGFSKTADETLLHWQRDSILRDVVTVVRAFRPQVIVAVFSGTPRDGHGHHQISAILAREAYDAAADTVRFPATATLGYGAWTPSKFYRASRFAPNEGTLTFNVGELSAFRGQTYAEIASQSRSQHLSQGFGALQRRGTSLDYLKLEQSRVSQPLIRERSPLENIAADWSRFRGVQLAPAARAALDSLPGAIAEVRRVERLVEPAPMVAPLARVVRLENEVKDAIDCAPRCRGAEGDLAQSVETGVSRATHALLAASGVLVEATAPRELVAVGDTVPVTVSVYNQGAAPLSFDGAAVWSGSGEMSGLHGPAVDVPADSSGRIVVPLAPASPSVPWWLAKPRQGDMFSLPAAGQPNANNLAIGEDHVSDTHVVARLKIANVPVAVDASPVVQRFADPARGEQRRPVAAVPAINVLLDNDVEYARAGVPFDRTYSVHVRSNSATARGVSVELTVPRGVTVDSSVRRLAMQPFSDAVVNFRVRGTLPAGRHTISATATSAGETFTSGYISLGYAHINPLRYYRPASVAVEAVQVTLPPKKQVAYIQGVGDNVSPMLSQLGLTVTTIAPDQLDGMDLSRFGAVVVGPRAFAASDKLVAQAARLQNYARAGGTVVLQYGQTEIEAPGILPYPVQLKRPTAERVTVEQAPVTILAPSAKVLSSPNRITAQDFDGWVQERATYVPTTVDPHWQRLLEIHDPGEPRNENALLVAPVGKGSYVYATLALFRQLPAGVPGAARIFLNLIAADGSTAPSSLPTP